MQFRYPVVAFSAMAVRVTARKKANPAALDHVRVPDKLYFRIGEVAALLACPAYVLRFWETEFPQLKPSKSNTGQRLYRKRDVELLVRIQRLLYKEGFTIAGARQVLKEDGKSAPQPLLFASNANGTKERRVTKLKEMRADLEDLKNSLRRK